MLYVLWGDDFFSLDVFAGFVTESKDDNVSASK